MKPQGPPSKSNPDKQLRTLISRELSVRSAPRVLRGHQRGGPEHPGRLRVLRGKAKPAKQLRISSKPQQIGRFRSRTRDNSSSALQLLA